MRNHVVAGVAAVLFGLSGQALSKVTPAEAERLGSELTPVGAERAGNPSGVIPEWTGGLKTPPKSWRKGEIETNPFPDDKPLFVITGSNLDLYRDKLSDGQIHTSALGRKHTLITNRDWSLSSCFAPL